MKIQAKQIEVVLSNSTVNAAGNITTTSAADVLATSMTITPGAGTYIVMFSCDLSHSTNGGSCNISIYFNNTLATNSNRTFTRGNQTIRGISYTQAIVTVIAGQTIEGRWNRGASGTGTMGNRSLILIKT